MIRLTGKWEMGAGHVSDGQIYFLFNSFKVASFMHQRKPHTCIRFYAPGDSLIGALTLAKEDFLRLAGEVPAKNLDDQLRLVPAPLKKKTPETGPVSQGFVRHAVHTQGDSHARTQ